MTWKVRFERAWMVPRNFR